VYSVGFKSCMFGERAQRVFNCKTCYHECLEQRLNGHLCYGYSYYNKAVSLNNQPARDVEDEFGLGVAVAAAVEVVLLGCGKTCKAMM